MGVISIVGKIVLVIVNLLILLIGIVFFVCGVIIVAGKDVYNSLVDTLEDELKQAASNAGINNLDTSNFTLSEVMGPLAYFLIGLGLIMAAIAILGLVGACCTIKVILIVYTIIITILFMIQLVIVILIYADKTAFDDFVKPYLKDTLKDFADIEGTDAASLIWNALMNYEECCGVDNYLDFHDSSLTKWPPASINSYTFTDQKTPVMCCKTKSTTYTCAEQSGATDANNNQSQGCYDKVYDLAVDNPVIITAFALILALQATCIFFSIWILCTMDNKVDII